MPRDTSIDCFLEAMEACMAARDSGDEAAMEQAAAEFMKRFEALDDWEPIESAPRDGTRVLLHFPHWGAIEGRYEEVITRGHMGRSRKLTWRFTDRLIDADESHQPTHWKPLPNPPQPKER